MEEQDREIEELKKELEEQKKELEEQKKKKKAIVGIGAVVVIAAILAVLFLMNRKEEPEGYVMDGGNYEQIAAEMDDRVAEGYFETYMNTEWTFEDGTSETQDAIFGNSPNNTKPIRCDVVLDETGEILYSTGVMPVGAQLPPFKLDRDLDAGTYAATCMVYLLDEAGEGRYTEYSSAGFSITITVLN